MAKVNRKYPEGGLVYKNKSAAEKAASKWAGTNEESLRGGGYEGEGTKIFKYYDEEGNVQSLTKKHTGMTLKMIEKSDKKSKQEDNRMKRGGRVRVNKKYDDEGELTGTAKEDRLNPGYVAGSGEKIYDSASAAEKAGSGITNKKTMYYRAPDGSIQWFILTPKHIAEEEHERLINKIREGEKEKAYHEKTYEEMTPEEQKRYDTHMESLRDYNESEREYKNGGRVKIKKKKKRLSRRGNRKYVDGGITYPSKKAADKAGNEWAETGEGTKSFRWTDRETGESGVETFQSDKATKQQFKDAEESERQQTSQEEFDKQHAEDWAEGTKNRENLLKAIQGPPDAEHKMYEFPPCCGKKNVIRIGSRKGKADAQRKYDNMVSKHGGSMKRGGVTSRRRYVNKK